MMSREKPLTEEILDLVKSGKPRSSTGSRKRSRASELFGSSSSDDEDHDSPKQQVNQKSFSLRNEAKGEEEDAFSDGFAHDLMGDEADRQRLAAMPEVEREAILFDRAQTRQAKIERKQLEKKMRERELLESGGKTRAQRALSSEAETKKQRLVELKAKRERKRKKANHDSDSDYLDGSGTDEGEIKDEYSEEATSDQDEPTEYSDYEERYKSKGSRQPRVLGKGQDSASTTNAKNTRSSKGEGACLDLDLANQLRLSRTRIEKWMFHPQFDDLAKNCLVRISIGMGKEGEPVYRLAEIKRIINYHRPYQLTPQTLVKKAAILKHGKSERTFRLDIVSNSDFTEKEFNRWKETLLYESQPLPTQRVIEDKLANWKAFESTPISDEVVAAMVEAKRELGGQARRNLVAERTVLQSQRNEAQLSGNQEEFDRIEEELFQLERDLTEHQAKKATNQKLDALAELNRRNRRLNIQQAREAEQRQTNRQTDNTTHHNHSNGSESKPLHHDPFSRRKCQPTHFHIIAETKPAELTSNPAILDQPGTPIEFGVNTKPTMSLHSDSNGAKPNSLQQPPPLDLFAVHNVDIDLDI